MLYIICYKVLYYIYIFYKNIYYILKIGFGDIALLTKSKRTATMVAKDDTHLLMLTK